MSDEKNIDSKNPSADDLTKTKKPGDIQLSEEELKQVSGGDLSWPKVVDKSSP
jgi:bacteriocin-like protein